MTATDPTPVTPITVRRTSAINDAISTAERLAATLRQYRGAQRDRFPFSHLARIEEVLEQTTNSITDMTAGERVELVANGAAHEEIMRLRVAAALPHRAPGFRPEPTLPASAVLRTVTTEDDDA